jgi:ABC-type protease/lipase transport system fused ATPase/permease subunit
VLAFPSGYDTQIGPDGAHLSAGQRQRIGLARALFGNPFLVVLDEPNANLDAEGDTAVARAVRGIRHRGGIAIIIAHRPSAISQATHLLVMEGGRMVAYGPKRDVIAHLNGSAKANPALPIPVRAGA